MSDSLNDTADFMLTHLTLRCGVTESVLLHFWLIYNNLRFHS